MIRFLPKSRIPSPLFVLFLLFIVSNSYSQVGINTTTPDADAMLDVVSTDKGALLPRVALTQTTNFAPLSAHVAGMLLYNTATVNDVTPGYYYNDGTVWIRLSSGGAGGDDWKTTGNSGTTAGTNFLGTTDSQDLQIRSNNSERMRILSNGQVSVNDPTPIAGDRFSVTGASGEYAINGYTTTGTGVYGQNSSGVGYGVFGASTNIGSGGYGAYGGIFESGLNAGYGAIAINTTASGANRTGLLAVGQNLGLISFPGTAALFYGQSGGASFASSSTGVGFMATGNAGLTAFYPVGGSGLAGTGLEIGVFGYATESGGNNPEGTIGTAGGYFANADGGYAYIGAWADPLGGGNNDQNFKIIGTGSVSTIVKDISNNPVIMYAPEAPESLFQDYGIGILLNGEAYIDLDPTLSKNIVVDENHPLKVFIQLEGDCNGVFVSEKSKNGFKVKELKKGKSNVQFSWYVVATRANEIFQGPDGSIKVSNNSYRFPPAPKELNVTKSFPKVSTGLNKTTPEKSIKLVSERKKN